MDGVSLARPRFWDATSRFDRRSSVAGSGVLVLEEWKESASVDRLREMSKKTSFVSTVGISALTFIVAAELCGWIGMSVISHRIATYGSVWNGLRSVKGVESKNDQDAQNGARVIHPYLGFATPPQNNTTLHRTDGEPLEEYGFDVGSGPLEMQPDPKKYVIGIFGGSVAKQLWEKHGTDALIATLKTSPQFRDKDIVISSGSFYSYRQPQDLLSLAYLLSIGAHFDAVILLDGFNDIFRPDPENMNGPISPLYPYAWAAYTGDLGNDPVFRLKFGKVAILDDMRYRRAQWLLRSPLRFSMAATLIWTVMDRRLTAASLTAEYELQEYATSTGSYAMHGPKIEYDSEDAYFKDRQLVWKKGSEAMSHLATGEGIAFFHFLQPNQYVPDSKPLHPDEQALVDSLPQSDEPRVRQSVEKGYPYLQQAGMDLKSEGIRFHDLTRIFVNQHDALYVDPCCHMNEEGNTLLGQKIANLMLQDMGLMNAAPQQR